MGLTERSFLERMELMGFTPSRAATNADRIRAMSDEELADYAYKVLGNYCCPPGREYATRACIIDMKEDCDNCWLNWLRQEAST